MSPTNGISYNTALRRETSHRVVTRLSSNSDIVTKVKTVVVIDLVIGVDIHHGFNFYFSISILNILCSVL